VAFRAKNIFSAVGSIGKSKRVIDSWQVKEKIDAVLAERQKLHTAWQHKKVGRSAVLR
jgi:hypothetical protein